MCCVHSMWFENGRVCSSVTQTSQADVDISLNACRWIYKFLPHIMYFYVMLDPLHRRQSQFNAFDGEFSVIGMCDAEI